MSFIDKLLPTKKILVVDIGTYKVKAAICEQKDGNFDII
jgi:cell division ATPase FtsA